MVISGARTNDVREYLRLLRGGHCGIGEGSPRVCVAKAGPTPRPWFRKALVSALFSSRMCGDDLAFGQMSVAHQPLAAVRLNRGVQRLPHIRK
jgi:hypothetical protein